MQRKLSEFMRPAAWVDGKRRRTAINTSSAKDRFSFLNEQHNRANCRAVFGEFLFLFVFLPLEVPLCSVLALACVGKLQNYSTS